MWRKTSGSSSVDVANTARLTQVNSTLTLWLLCRMSCAWTETTVEIRARAKDSIAKSDAKATAPRLGGAPVQTIVEASEAIDTETRDSSDKSIPTGGFARNIPTNHACATLMASW